MVIYNGYNNRPPVVQREADGESITETAGYIPPDVQVRNMLSAGLVLQRSREGIYDSDVDPQFDDDGSIHRLDSRDADMVDVHEAAQEVKERLKNSPKDDSESSKKKSKKKTVEEVVDDEPEEVVDAVSDEVDQTD